MPNPKVQQMNSDGELHDIEALSLEPTNEYTGKGFHIVGTGTIRIDFNKQDNAGGVVEFNSKGNLSVESLTKSVNLEAKKNIQVKPTEDIIFDSGRRIASGNGNEVHLKFQFDDYNASDTGHYDGDDEKWAELKLEARNIDLRCKQHGGIAIQPCGKDGQGFENKIKFESSRISPLGTAETIQHATEGGKGLEFGTFNNEHSSLFTGDYRFNRAGKVYAAQRGTPVTSDGKTDYPTQDDDFKDIIDDNIASSWEDIVLAGRQKLTLISKSGNVKSFDGPILNTMHIPVYVDANKNIYLPAASLDTVYDSEGNAFVFGPDVTSSTTVYTDAAHTTVVTGDKLFLKDVNDNYFIVDLNSSHQVKKYSSSDHQAISVDRVLTAEQITAMGNTITQISAGGYINLEENPILNAIKNIITDSTVDSYEDFVAAMQAAFGWETVSPTT